MDCDVVSKKIIELIDARIKLALTSSRMPNEAMADVTSVFPSTGKASVRLMDEQETKITLINKSGEVLNIGDSVAITWRGALTAANAYITRRVGKPVMPTEIIALTQAEYDALETVDPTMLYVIIIDEEVES